MCETKISIKMRINNVKLKECDTIKCKSKNVRLKNMRAKNMRVQKCQSKISNIKKYQTKG